MSTDPDAVMPSAIETARAEALRASAIAEGIADTMERAATMWRRLALGSPSPDSRERYLGHAERAEEMARRERSEADWFKEIAARPLSPDESDKPDAATG
jgi:hypothetical protein